MADRNSSLSPNRIHPNPFPNSTFQHGTSQSYVSNDSAIQDHTSWNPTLETPESFAPPRNLYPSRPILCSSSQVHHGSSLLEGSSGNVVSMAKDRRGSRLLRLKIDEGAIEDIEMILFEVKDHMHELMTHHLGNYLIGKIFESKSVSDDQKDYIVVSIIQDMHMLRDVCMDKHGSWVIQRMLENIKKPTRMDEVTNIMNQITVPLMKNVNGGFVVLQCVKNFPATYQEKILYQVALNCVDIAKDKSGSPFIEKCLDHAEPEAIVPLVEAIIYNATFLAEDPFGNYVVKNLVGMGILEVNGRIISELRGKYVQLSRDKHASNVVQHLLQYSEEKDSKIIILELMKSLDFLSVLRDPYGNYVAQSAVQFSRGYLQMSLVHSIWAKSSYLRSHLYGEKVLAFVAKIQF